MSGTVNMTLPSLSCALPTGWIDQSMALFLMPAPPPDPRSLHNGKGVSPGNIAITWAVSDQPAAAILEVKLAALRAVEGVLVVEPAAIVNDVAVAVVSVPQGQQRVFQVVAVRLVGELAVSVVGSALGATLSELKQHTLTAATSLSLTR